MGSRLEREYGVVRTCDAAGEGWRLAGLGIRSEPFGGWALGGRGVGGAAARVVFERWNAEISIRSNGASKLEFSERQPAGRSSFR